MQSSSPLATLMDIMVFSKVKNSKTETLSDQENGWRNLHFTSYNNYKIRTTKLWPIKKTI